MVSFDLKYLRALIGKMFFWDMNLCMHICVMYVHLLSHFRHTLEYWLRKYLAK